MIRPLNIFFAPRDQRDEAVQSNATRILGTKQSIPIQSGSIIVQQKIIRLSKRIRASVARIQTKINIKIRDLIPRIKL